MYGSGSSPVVTLAAPNVTTEFSQIDLCRKKKLLLGTYVSFLCACIRPDACGFHLPERGFLTPLNG
jgi:hypothetical protein